MTETTSQDIAKHTPADNALAEKIILVTGAGDGIGREAALHFAKHGATVVLLGRTLAKLEQVYDEIEQHQFPQAAIYPMNFEGSTEHDYEAMRDIIKNEFGRLDGLLHNAALLGPRTPIKNYNLEDWNKVFQVNTLAPFALTKSLMPLLENAQHASIVFTGSGVGLAGAAYWGAYAASKAANENLVQTFADELEGTGQVRVNSINPGPVRTRMRAAAYPAEDPATVVPAETIMNRYIYLMSDESQGLSGKQIDAQP